MDTLEAPVIVERLGVSLPTAHRLLDREVIPRLGRGRTRIVPVRITELLRWLRPASIR